MEVNWKPKLGMRFDNLEEVMTFWRAYGGRVGFGVRKDGHNKSKKDGKTIVSAKYCCSKEGFRGIDKRDENPKNPHKETRIGCMARLKVNLVDRKYEITQFTDQHNHELHSAETVHMLPSQRKISEVQAYQIELAEDCGLRQKDSFELMSTQAGGRMNVGFNRTDVKNYLKSVKHRQMAYGEAGILLQYFQKQLANDPLFFHAYQMDSDEKITNVFWADARMLVDYRLFGDVMSLDTTFGTNKKNRPLAVFCGFNHYRTTVIFGAALLYDETVESFKWLFQTFLQAHQHKKPLTVFTDQDAAMARGLSEVMPETVHALCSWHLMRNATKYLAHLPRGETHILQEVSRCMYEIIDEDQFEAAWSKMLLDHNAQDNQWLTSTYQLKRKWAACFMKKVFTGDMRSTQLSECLNSDFKDVMHPNLDLIQFFKRFERIVEVKRYIESKHDYASKEKFPRLRNPKSLMLKQLSNIYTYTIFDLFQQQYDEVIEICVKEKDESQDVRRYVVSHITKGTERIVLFNPSDSTITCNCGKFETSGILCCHALKIFDVNDVKLHPCQYIIPRWTKKARAGVTHDVRGKEKEEDPRLHITHQFRLLSRDAITVAAEAAKSDEAVEVMRNMLLECMKQVSEIISRGKCLDNDVNTNTNVNANTIPTSQCTPQPTGFKQKDGARNKRRTKSGVEVRGKKQKRETIATTTRINDVQAGVSSSAPPAPQTHISELSFTEMLMAPIDHSMPSLESLHFSTDFPHMDH